MDSILPKYKVTELPSRFIGYPEDTEIFIQPYTAGQAINIELVGRNNINVMEEVLDGVITKYLDKEMLTPQDILFLGVYRNLVSSKSDKISVQSICPKCLAENKEAKSLGDIKFKELEGFDKDCYPLEVDFNKYIMHFEVLTYKAFKYCMKKYRGAKTYQLAFQVVDYTNKETGETFSRPYYTNSPEERLSTAAFDKYISDVRNILFDLIDEDKDVLNEVINILEDYGTKPIEVTCQDERCKHQYSVGLDEEGVLLTPFRESGQSARDRIKLRKNDVNKSTSIETDEPQRSGNASGQNNDSDKEITNKSVRISSKKPEKQIHYFSEND